MSPTSSNVAGAATAAPVAKAAGLTSEDTGERNSKARKMTLTLTSLPAEVFEQIGFFAAQCTPEQDTLPSNPPDSLAEKRSSQATTTTNSVCQTDAERMAVPQDVAGDIENTGARATTGTASGLSAKSARGSGDVKEPETTSDSYLTTPSILRNLLLVCRTVHDRLNASANPRLYARIFRTRFDVAAIRRRFGRAAISSRSLASELKRRYTSLKRMRFAVEQGQFWSAKDKPEASDAEITENLWVAYLMLLENDGLNMQQLRWAQVDAYVNLFQSQELLESAIRDGYPQTTLSRALAVHVSYLMTDVEDGRESNRDEDEERLFLLRPFVFAAHKYEAFLAPWTCRQMPIRPEEGRPSGDTEGRSTDPGNPFLANLTPKNNSYKLQYCNQTVTLCPPVISHAACQAFFSKVERDPAVNGFNSIQDLQEENFEQVGEHTSSPQPEGASRDQKSASSASLSKSNPAALRSLDHDKDIKRLLLCNSPSSPGFGHLPHVDSLRGSWEGRFTFFDFDSYRDMLGGNIRALYEGPFGEQPQVWKLREHIVKIDDSTVVEGGKGTVLNSGYHDVDDEPDRYKTLSSDELGEVQALAARTKLFDDIEEQDRRASHSQPSGVEGDSNGVNQLQSGSKATSGQTSSTSDRYEILLSGTGHSAWGRFILRGRIRSWDGLVTLVKEYRPDGRGRWLYRGYVVAGNKLVGRWRDTFTPADMCGYEGCFQLYKRS